MRVRRKYVYVDAIRWWGAVSYQDVCDFVGISPQDGHGDADGRRVFLPGGYEREVVAGDWIYRSGMVGQCQTRSHADFRRGYDQVGVSECGRADFPFARPGVARYREKPSVIDAVQWLGDTNFSEVCAFVGVDAAEAAADPTSLRLPRPSWDDEVDLAEPGMWILRWAEDLFLALNSHFVLGHYDPMDAGQSLVDGVASYRSTTDVPLADAIYWNGEANYLDVCAFLGMAPQEEFDEPWQLRVSAYGAPAVPGSWMVREHGGGDVRAYDWDNVMEYQYELVVAPDEEPWEHASQWKRPRRFRRRPEYVLALRWLGPANHAEVCAFLGRPLPTETDDRDVIHLPGSDEQAVTPGMWIVTTWSGYRGLTDESFHAAYQRHDPPSDLRIVRAPGEPGTSATTAS